MSIKKLWYRGRMSENRFLSFINKYELKGDEFKIMNCSLGYVEFIYLAEYELKEAAESR